MQFSKKTILIASVAANALLCIGLFSMRSNNVAAGLNAGAISRSAATSRAMAPMSPAPTFRSAIAQAYCEEVVDPTKNMRYETMSYMPDFGPQDMEAQVGYMMQQGLIPCIEFDAQGGIFRENSNMPGYYDGRYWTMWKLPLFGAVDPKQVMYEVVECRKHNPNSYIRILGFDNVKQVQCMGFVAVKPPQRAF